MAVAVSVGVSVAVAVAVAVGIAVEVPVGIAVAVSVGFAVAVSVGVSVIPGVNAMTPSIPPSPCADRSSGALYAMKRDTSAITQSSARATCPRTESSLFGARLYVWGVPAFPKEPILGL